eukprot:TRINITY_DN44186_c0_g1_i1.p1 TRINITY_DN44186_c0_g1~~TRINITY_DN44186_c0_g1_i1.p1  ORF type:complete len:465 (+),score=88.95 TRINITY_DN44186_c0_g1_i1:364-1758(+)
MAVGHAIADDMRKEGSGCFGSGAEGLEWSPYTQAPKLHSGALQLAVPAPEADLEVTFYALSPLLEGSPAKLIVMVHQEGATLRPSVELTPLDTFSHGCQLLCGKAMVSRAPGVLNFTYCLALAKGDQFVRDKSGPHTRVCLRSAPYGSNPSLSVWCTANPVPAFPLSELDPALADSVRIYTEDSEAATLVFVETLDAAIDCRIDLKQACELFAMARSSCGGALCGLACFLEKLEEVRQMRQLPHEARLRATLTALCLTPAIVADKQDATEHRANAYTIVLDYAYELSEDIMISEQCADTLQAWIAHGQNALVLQQSFETISRVAAENGGKSIRVLPLINRLAVFSGMRSRGAQHVFSRLAQKGSTVAPTITESFFRQEVRELLKPGKLFDADLKQPGDKPHPLAQSLMSMAPTIGAMAELLGLMFDRVLGLLHEVCASATMLTCVRRKASCEVVSKLQRARCLL